MLTKLLCLLATIILLITINGVVSYAETNGSNLILERDDTNFFTVEADTIKSNELILSGLAMHSSLVVGEVNIIFMKDAIHVKIVMIPATKGLRGDFRVPVYITKNVKKIYFGKKMTIVWER